MALINQNALMALMVLRRQSPERKPPDFSRFRNFRTVGGTTGFLILDSVPMDDIVDELQGFLLMVEWS